MLASPLLLQYDTSWQEKASAWVLLGVSVVASAAMPAALPAIVLAAGTLRTAGKLMLVFNMHLQRPRIGSNSIEAMLVLNLSL